jgi:hypothetical protein
MAGGADFLRERHRRGTSAATNIDNPLARFWLGAVDQDVSDRRQHDVLALLPVGPALAARPVPVGDLIGVLIVAYREIHVLDPLLQRRPSIGAECGKFSGRSLSKIAAGSRICIENLQIVITP